MPVDKRLYPKNWNEISLAKRQAAGWKCERCGIAQGAISPKGGKVTLTVMHLDHNPANCEPENLQAACNACHLAYDLPLHLKHAHETRRKKQEDAGQLRLLEDAG